MKHAGEVFLSKLRIANFLGWQGGARKEIGVSYKLVPMNNNFVGWFPLAELVLKKGFGVPCRLVPTNIIAYWCML
jgi:hypothetical protein